MKRKGAKKILVLVTAAGLLAWVGSGQALKPMAAAAGWFSGPLMRPLVAAGRGIGGFFGMFTHVSSLAERNAQLEHEVAKLRQQLAADGELRAENLRLTTQLGFAKNDEYKYLPAPVIAYQPDNFRQFLTIARGSRDGIIAGMAVVSDGVLVGTVSEVLPGTAKVFLVTDPNFRVNGLDQTSRATGTVRGQLGAGLVMEKIAQNERVSQADVIITSGLGGQLPKGLIIGRVEAVNQKANAVFQTAQISTGLTIPKLELVFVVMP